MPTSRDPEAHKRQLANLRPDAARKHGAYSEAKLAPLRERFVGELAEQFVHLASRQSPRTGAPGSRSSTSGWTSMPVRGQAIGQTA